MVVDQRQSVDCGRAGEPQCGVSGQTDYATSTNSVDPVVAHLVAENWVLVSAGALPTTPAWTGESNQTNAYFGYSVNTAGDVDGDGFDDVIVGAYAYDITGTPTFTDAGRAYVYYGSGEGLSQNPAWIFSGDKASAYVGVSVGTAGDVNGDGYADVVVGASWLQRAEQYHRVDRCGAVICVLWIANRIEHYAQCHHQWRPSG